MGNPDEPRRVEMERGILPEGIVGDGPSRTVSWVDIELGALHTGTVARGAITHERTIETGDQLGCALPSEAGGWVCGLGRSLATVWAAGAIEATPPLLRPSERFNDGHVDPQGRLVIGTLDSDGPNGRQLLLRLEHDGAVTMISETVGISNGIAWSPDGAWMYHADTAARTISRRSYGSEVGPPEPFLAIDGMPDGIAVDEHGRLWVTVFDAGRVDVYDPEGTRRPELTVTLAEAHVASVGFAGPDLDVLVLATGMPLMRGWLALRRPRDGWLFTMPSPARGLPVRRWTPAPLPAELPRVG